MGLSFVFWCVDEFHFYDEEVHAAQSKWGCCSLEKGEGLRVVFISRVLIQVSRTVAARKKKCNNH